MTSPAEELRQAAFHLRNLTRRPELAAAVDLPYTEPLARLLERHAEFADLYDRLTRMQRATAPTEDERTAEVRAALTVARAINAAPS